MLKIKGTKELDDGIIEAVIYTLYLAKTYWFNKLENTFEDSNTWDKNFDIQVEEISYSNIDRADNEITYIVSAFVKRRGFKKYLYFTLINKNDPLEYYKAVASFKLFKLKDEEFDILENNLKADLIRRKWEPILKGENNNDN